MRLFALAAIVALTAVACSEEAAPADSTAAPERTPASTPTRAPTPVSAPIPTATPAAAPTAVSAPIPTATPAATPTAVSTPTSTPAPTVTPAPTATSEPTATPVAPSAQDVLNAVTAAMRGVTTAHVESHITGQVGLGSTSLDVEVEVVGDLVVPDRSHLTMKMAAAGITVELELIAIGNDLYMKNPLTGEWETNTELALPIGTESFSMGAFGTDFQPEVAANFTLTGLEELDGERVYRLRGTVTGADLAELMDDQTASQGEADVQYWVGVDDYLVRKTEISFEDSGTDPLTNAAYMNQVTYVTTLSAYNSPVTIEKPEVATGAGGLFPSDDHGDSHETATPIKIGDAIRGEIGSEFDIDAFRFPAEEGRSYRIEVTRGTLEDPLVVLYNSAGDAEFWDEDGGTVLWEPLWSGDYYVLVEGSGRTGTYTLRVTIELVSDDHGDRMETATQIEIGDTIDGKIDPRFDLDAFRFPAEEGQSYRIVVAPGTLEDPFVSLYSSAADLESSDLKSWGEDNVTILWEPLRSDDYFVVVEGFGLTGTYTVRVTIE